MKKLLYLLSVFIYTTAFAQKIKTGEDVINAMYNKYNSKWYKYFTFTQDGTFYKDGKAEKTEVWHEAAKFPGNLVIKYDSINSKNGVVFSNYKVCGIKDGVAKTPRPFIHDLLLVGFDVYFLKPTHTIHLLDSLGYNLKNMHEDVFEGSKVYVVGALKGDDQSNKFWIDKERLYMHRILYKKGEHVMDVVFTDYEKINGNWTAKKVIFKNDGQLQMVETYYNIKFPKNLNDSIFEPKYFSSVKW